MDPRFVPPDEGDRGIDTADEMNNNPRIEVTMSMLYAYANMRGKPPTEFDPDSADPLHSALYPIRSRSCVQAEVHLPFRADVGGMPSVYEPPAGTRYFWDPIKAKIIMEHKLQPLMELREATKRDSGYNSTTTSGTLPCFGAPREHPSTLAPNHYKGAEVWSNFGYVKINDSWVDPESERELSAAYNDKKEAYHFAGTLSVIIKPRCAGPKIMIREEERSLYEWYLEEVSLGADADTEGDPRDLRITPETFAFWAQGAKRGEHYERRVLEPQEPLSRAQYDMEGVMPPKIMPHPQFDDNGSIMTGEYEIEKNPTLLHGSLGVNMARPPHTFSFMSPQTGIDLEKAHYLDLHSEASSTTASTLEPYTCEGAGEYLSPEDPIAGIHETFDRVHRLRRKEHFRDSTIEVNTWKRDVAVFERRKLDREVDRIEKTLKELRARVTAEEAKRTFTPRDPPTPAQTKINKDQPSPPRTPTFTQEEASSFILSGSPTPTRTSDIEFHPLGPQPESPPRSPTPRQTFKNQKGQYRRFFKELAESEQIVDRETREANDALTTECIDIEDEVNLLRHWKGELQDALEAIRPNGSSSADVREYGFEDLYAGPYEDTKEIEGGLGLEF